MISTFCPDNVNCPKHHGQQDLEQYIMTETGFWMTLGQLGLTYGAILNRVIGFNVNPIRYNFVLFVIKYAVLLENLCLLWNDLSKHVAKAWCYVTSLCKWSEFSVPLSIYVTCKLPKVIWGFREKGLLWQC